MRKTIYTLCINDYEPRITELTFPLMRYYAQKIGAEFVVINERKYPDMPLTYEKFQVAELAKQRGDEWAIFFDADTLISPECFDFTTHIPKNTVAHNGSDMAGVRWRYDNYLLRDGRNIGSCTWCVIASEWTVGDLWHPADLSVPEILSNIHTTIGEKLSGHCETSHLIDDYLLSRNIARFGLKFTTLGDVCGNLGMRMPDGRGANSYLWHKYTISNDQKVREMLAILTTPQKQPAFAEKGEFGKAADGSPVVRTADGRIIEMAGVGWGLISESDGQKFREKWGIK